jgi:hypothetical protein
VPAVLPAPRDFPSTTLTNWNGDSDAAWAEGTPKVAFEAIKQSINSGEAAVVTHLAVDLSVAEAHSDATRDHTPADAHLAVVRQSIVPQWRIDGEPTHGEVGWGGRIRTYEWRDQNDQGPFESVS